MNYNRFFFGDFEERKMNQKKICGNFEVSFLFSIQNEKKIFNFDKTSWQFKTTEWMKTPLVLSLYTKITLHMRYGGALHIHLIESKGQNATFYSVLLLLLLPLFSILSLLLWFRMAHVFVSVTILMQSKLFCCCRRQRYGTSQLLLLHVLNNEYDHSIRQTYISADAHIYLCVETVLAQPFVRIHLCFFFSIRLNACLYVLCVSVCVCLCCTVHILVMRTNHTL